MDVENAEWGSMKSMLKTGILEHQVKQFALEIHLMNNNRGMITIPNITDLHERWAILHQLELIGFRRWYIHFNRSGKYKYKGRVRTCCYEMVYVNTAFIKQRR